MSYFEMSDPFFDAWQAHGLDMPINQWSDNDWPTFKSVWCMGGEL
jgi:hypothetical protein